jgi:hypothetical protein
MANFQLSQTGNTDIQTAFRFRLNVATQSNSSELGLNNKISAYIISTDLPSATGEPIVWSLPGGMQNHQAGKRTIKPINLEFVIPSVAGSSWYRTVEKWHNATYNLNNGQNVGKATYCTDGISIALESERGETMYIFRLLRAQPTETNYGAVNSEGNELIKVTTTLVYDNYELTDGNGTLLRGQSN